MHSKGLTSHKFWHHVTVEPALFFTDIAYQIIEFLNTNLYLQKTCRNDTSHVPDLSTPCDTEQAGLTWMTICYSSAATLSGNISLILTMFATTYSDIAGRKRKLFIVLPIIGFLMQTLSAILQTAFWSWPPLLGIVLNVALPSMFGGFQCIVIFAKVCICDKSQPGNRLTQITILTLIKSTALVIGKGASGYLLEKFGFLYSYMVVFLLFLMSLACAIVLVNDKPVAVEQKISLGRVFNLREVHESLKIILFSKKPARHRAAIWILQFVGTLVYFCFCGEQSLLYLYFRTRFHWRETKYTTYSAYKIATGMAGSILCTLTMDRLFKIHDSVIGALTAFMDTLAALGSYLVVDNTLLYVIPLLDIFQGIAMSTCYSLMSKFFTDKEFGRLHSVYMLFGLLNSLGVPFYNYVFRMTMNDWPNAFFLLSMVLHCTIAFAYSITYFLSYDIR